MGRPNDRSPLPLCMDCKRPRGGRPGRGRERCADCRPNQILVGSGKSKHRREVYARGDRISIRQLIAWHGPQCSICRKTTRTNLPVGHHDKPTVDHVIPITAGGEHYWSNVMVACGYCNLAKKHRPVTQWSYGGPCPYPTVEVAHGTTPEALFTGAA